MNVGIYVKVGYVSCICIQDKRYSCMLCQLGRPNTSSLSSGVAPERVQRHCEMSYVNNSRIQKGYVY